MKILVPVKRVLDHSVNVRVKSDGSGVDLANARMSINPFDEIAIEEAVRLKEAGQADEVICVSIGLQQVQETLRTALAIGADRALHIRTDVAVEPLAVAKLLKAVVEEEAIDLVLMGKQAIDDDSNQTGQMLAALLGWGQGIFASRVELAGEAVRVSREIDSGTETVELGLPAVITTDLRLNKPRHASLPNIMKAKQKPLADRPAEGFGLDLTPRLKVLRVEPPRQRQPGIMVGSVAELLHKLRTEAGVL